MFNQGLSGPTTKRPQQHKHRDIWPGAIASDNVLSELYRCTPLDIGQDKSRHIAGEKGTGPPTQAYLQDPDVRMKQQRAKRCNLQPGRAALGPHLEAGLAGELAAAVVDGAVVGEDVDEVQAVALARCEIVGVMRRRDLHSTRPERYVHQLRISDDGDLAPIQGMHHMLPMQVRIPATTALFLRQDSP